MGAAVVVQERTERPGWLERLLVVGLCAALLVTVAILDDRAASREKARAYAVIAERAKHAAERSSREAMTAPVAAPAAARTDRLGGRTPIPVATGPGVGAVTTQTALRRVQGPRTPDARSAIPEPAPAAPARRAAPAPAPAAVPAASSGARRGEDSLLLGLMAALGLSMAGGGLRLLSRRSA